MRVSVVVPTFRRPELLDRCLAALAAQNHDPADYEILIADDAASAETRRQVEEWSMRADPRVRRTCRFKALTVQRRPATPDGDWHAGRSLPSRTTTAFLIPGGSGRELPHLPTESRP